MEAAKAVSEKGSAESAKVKQDKMTDAELERILEESLGALHLEEEKKQAPAPSIPQPESASASERLMMKQQLGMSYQMMAEMLNQDPNQARMMVRMVMGMMIQAPSTHPETSLPDLPLIVPVVQLTSNEADKRIVEISPDQVDRLKALGAEDQMSSSQVDQFIAEKVFTVITQEEANQKMLAFKSKLEEPKLSAAIPKDDLVLMLKGVGVDSKFYEALLAKEDLMVELQLARIYAASKHPELMELFIDAELSQMEMATSGGSLELNGLRKLCTSDQFDTIRREVTSYLLNHYNLGS